ncbi:peptide chain release factor 1 [Chloroflexota bacterium]
MWERLDRLEKRFEELNRQMAEPAVAADLEKLRPLAQERAAITDLVSKYGEYQTVTRTLEETRGMLDEESDRDMAALVKQEIEKLESLKEQLFGELRVMLLPRDANDDKDVIMEIRAGAGGDEAGLFAGDLLRMYTRYAQSRSWKVDIINVSESGIGSIKEVIFEIKGRGAFSRLKYERGVHRVQRVPTTESSGRIHTSTATVAVLPEAGEVEVSVSPGDLKVDIFHSGGAGGQNVNKVATAVRLTHLPTGMVVVCQDERSQLRNKTKAMAVLRARLLDIEQRKQESEISQERRFQVGTGDRSEKVRTYNFPQDRITDHRIGSSFRNLPAIMEGGLDGVIDAIATSDHEKQLEGQAI